MEVYYTYPSYPYGAASESYLHYAEGSPHANLQYHYVYPPQIHQYQDSAYWTMYTNYYRYASSVACSVCHYGVYGVHDEQTSMDKAWEYSSGMNIEEPTEADTPYEETTSISMQSIPEECTGSPEADVDYMDDANETDSESEVASQDDIDPDDMSYEELLDLGETVGNQCRGLSQEVIDLLPKSRFKCIGIFTRKRSAERCVICQMRYRRGDHLINLPCKHMYHTDCGSTWLKINKACPICNSEVSMMK